MISKNLLEVEIQYFEMYKKDLEKIKTGIFIKREKEILRLESKIKNIEELSEDELQELWGMDCITKKVYERRLKNLRDFEQNKATFKDSPTALSLYLKLLDKEIKDIDMNILLDKEELNQYML